MPADKAKAVKKASKTETVKGAAKGAAKGVAKDAAKDAAKSAVNGAAKAVAIIMGSDSDYPTLKSCFATLEQFGVPVKAMVCSAHRTPERAAEFAKTAEENGIGVIIAAAGKAAHLPGVMAAFTCLPVIGLPIKASTLDGLDALLSIVQMPAGVPVATVAIDGAENAALLAVQILSVGDAGLREKMREFKRQQALKVEEKDKALQALLNK